MYILGSGLRDKETKDSIRHITYDGTYAPKEQVNAPIQQSYYGSVLTSTCSNRFAAALFQEKPVIVDIVGQETVRTELPTDPDDTDDTGKAYVDRSSIVERDELSSRVDHPISQRLHGTKQGIEYTPVVQRGISTLLM